jgi:hypothetical protein
MVSFCIKRVIWRLKNHTFNDGVLSVIELKSLFVRLFEWAQTFGTIEACSVVEFIDSISLIL